MTKNEIDIINSLKPIVIKSIGYKKVDYRDIMQDLFLKILINYEKFSSIKESEKVYYALRALNNIIIDKWRRRVNLNKRARFVSILQENGFDYKFCLRTKEEVSGKIELKEVSEILAQYPMSKELIWNINGYTAREIAKISGQSINTVLGRIRYTRKFLKEQYNGTEN